MDPERRQHRLADACLYFVCDAAADPVELEGVLGQALAGGVDVLQLRDKLAPPTALRAAAGLFAAAAAEWDVLFIVNDDPGLAADCGADGVHVGQDDVDVAAARELLGGPAIVGLSTHRPEQLDAALAAEPPGRPDYVSVGPIWETPTKPGRAATGLGYVRYARERAGTGSIPWFAIGGVDRERLASVVEAGAERVVVVRAIREAEDPRSAARGLREGLATIRAAEAGSR
jgi:thiamine-phosphate pyrophosphorylase